MKVEIWSDVVCPFCYIGKRRWEQALAGFREKEEVEVIWRSFQLDPDLPPKTGQNIHEYLAQRKGISVAEGKRMNDSMAAMAKEEGLEFNFETAILTNTLYAHQVLHLAQKKGIQNQLKEKLFSAYFTQGKNIGDPDSLIQIGEEAGLDGAEIREALQTNAYLPEVQQDIYMAQQIGVRGVPFFVFNSKYAVSGAQPADLFKEVLEKVRAEEKPELNRNQDEAAACRPDGTCD